MTDRRRYLVLEGYEPQLAEYDWIQPGQTYEGVLASDVLPADVPWVRLVHPRDGGLTALISMTYLAELAPGARAE